MLNQAAPPSSADSAAHAPELSQWCARLQTRLPGIREVHVVAWQPPALQRLAATPQASEDLALYSAAAENALNTHRGVLAPAAQADSDIAEVIAFPIELSEHQQLVLVGLAQLPPKHVQLIMEQIQAASGWLHCWLLRDSVAGDQKRVRVIEQCFELIAEMAQSPDHTQGLQQLCTDLAERLGASRVAFVRKRWSGAPQLMALSGQPKFDRRTKLNDATEQVAHEALLRRGPVHWRDGEAQASPIQTLAQLHQDKAVTAIALPDRRGAFTAALVVHWSHSTRLEDLEDWSALWLLTNPIQHLQAQAQRNALRVAWDQLHGLGRRLLGTGHYKTKAVALGAVLVLAGLLGIEGEATIKAEASVLDTGQRVVSAPAEGYLASVQAIPGVQVAKDQVLAQLNDDTLRLKRLELLAQLSRFQAEKGIAFRDGERGNISVANAQAREIQAKLAQIDTEIEQTRIRASIAGTVIDKDLRQRIGTRIEFGEALFTIAPGQQAEIKLEIANRDAQAFVPGLHGKLRMHVDPTNPLDIELVRIKPAAESVDGELKFVGYAQVKEPPEYLQNGMIGVARLDIGPANLWHIWVRPVWDSVTLFVWRWMP